jgi:hypothetical protein
MKAGSQIKGKWMTAMFGCRNFEPNAVLKVEEFFNFK